MAYKTNLANCATVSPDAQRMKGVQGVEGMVEWVDWVALPNDLWAAVSAHLGLQALTLRRTCKSLRHALAFLPRATELAYRLILRGSVRAATHPVPVFVFRRLDPGLVNELARLPYREFFHVLDTLSEVRNNKLLHWECCGYKVGCKSFEIGAVLEMRSIDLHTCSLEDKEGHVLTEGELVDAMSRFFLLGVFHPNRIINRTAPGVPASVFETNWTSTWHLAAEKGMLQVLRFLAYDCRGIQPLHTRTPGGNNAYAHAQRALERASTSPHMEEEQKAREQAKYCRVLDYLRDIGLEDRPWRDETNMIASDTSDASDASGASVDLTDASDASDASGEPGSDVSESELYITG